MERVARQLCLPSVLAALVLVLQGCGGGDTTPTTTTFTTTSTSTTTTTTTTTNGNTNPMGCGDHCELCTEHGWCTKCSANYQLTGLFAQCLFECHSNLTIKVPVAKASSKGLCLDDTTFLDCPSQMPSVWPNTNEPVQSLRMFKAWGFGDGWTEAKREIAWGKLVNYTKSKTNTGGVKILIGTQITCNETEDDADWENVKSLMNRLGGAAVMGVAIGNELELLSTKQGIPSDCIEKLWAGGYLWNKTKSRFADLNKMDGFHHVPITSVFGGLALAGNPFIDTPQAAVLTFLKQVVADEDIHGRWVFTFNFYPYFDPSMPLDPGSPDQCTGALKGATCLDSNNCNVPATAVKARQSMQTLTGSADYKLWLGETGWSYPKSDTLNTPMASCPAWSSRHTFLTYYERFLAWDMELEGYKAPDHVFYFTMRDSVNFGVGEHFGLARTCEDNSCKLQEAAFHRSVISV